MKGFTQANGVKGTYEFMRLSYHRFQEDIGPDPMHTVKDVMENITKIMNGTIKRDKIIAAEKEFKPSNRTLDCTTLILSDEEIKRVNGRIETLIFPCNATGCKKSFLTNTRGFHPTHA